MGQATGAKVKIGFYEETTFKAVPATPDLKNMYVVKSGLNPKQNLIDSNTITPSRGKAKPFRGNKDNTGSIDIELSSENIDPFLKQLMGSQANTGTGPYTHTYKIGTLPVGFGIETDYGSDISGSGRFAVSKGLRVSSATFTFPTEGAATASFNIQGSGKADLGAVTIDAAAGYTDTGFTPWSTFEITVIEEGGVAIANVKEASITIDNGLDTAAGYVIGSQGERIAIPEGQAMVSGSIKCVFDSATMMNKALAGTTSSLHILMSRGTGLGTAGNESLDFLVEQLIYEPNIPSVDGPGGIEITLPFKAFASGVNNGLTIVNKNNVA
jgi:hypothetical protein